MLFSANESNYRALNNNQEYWSIVIMCSQGFKCTCDLYNFINMQTLQFCTTNKQLLVHGN